MNEKIASLITERVGTMVCAYLFAILALISLPAALRSGDLIVIVAWVAQTFLQLVLLPIIMVGQSVQSRRTEATIASTHELAVTEHEETREILRELGGITRAMHAALTE